MSGASTSKGTQDQQTTQNTQPGFQPQVNSLNTMFTGADNALSQAQNSGVPQASELTAGMTPQQIATFQQMIGYGGNSAIPGQQAAAGSNMTNSGMNATNGALTNLGAFNPSSTNNAAANIAGGNAYAAGSNIPGQVAADMFGANQEANQVTIPGIEQNAAGTGNVNSSRTGIADGMVKESLANQAAGLGANLQANAFNTGAGLTANTNSTNNAQALSGYGAAANAGNSAFNSGLDASGQSINNQGNLFNLAGQGGAGLQQGNQLNDTNASQMYDQSQNNPFMALNNYMGLIGSQNWGQNSSGTSDTQTTSTPSMMAQIAGLLGAGGSLAKGLSGPGK